MPNPDGKLRPGMYVSAKLTAEMLPELSVPAAAIGKINDEPVMYLADGGKAVRVVVQLHRGDAQYTQILRYRRSNAAEWTAVTGEERVASPAGAVSDGQALPYASARQRPHRRLGRSTPAAVLSHLQYSSCRSRVSWMTVPS